MFLWTTVRLSAITFAAKKWSSANYFLKGQLLIQNIVTINMALVLQDCDYINKVVKWIEINLMRNIYRVQCIVQER